MNADVRSMFDREYLGAWDLVDRDGKPIDVTAEIVRVAAGVLTSKGDKKTKKPIVFFKGKEKGFALNKTNTAIIAKLYTHDTRLWVGKRITMYATTTSFGRETVDCIRVRPTEPRPMRPGQREPDPPPQQEPPTDYPLPGADQ